MNLDWLNDAPSLAAAKRGAMATIDGEHSRRLGLISSPEPLVQRAYTEKEAEARAVMAAADPDPADYPMLAGELRRSGDIETAAQTVLTMADQWRAALAAFDDVRLAAKDAVEAAGDRDAVAAALKAVIWPSA